MPAWLPDSGFFYIAIGFYAIVGAMCLISRLSITYAIAESAIFQQLWRIARVILQLIMSMALLVLAALLSWAISDNWQLKVLAFAGCIGLVLVPLLGMSLWNKFRASPAEST